MNVANGVVALVLVVALDTVKPTVKITNPVLGNVSGNVVVSVKAADDSGVAGIRQKLLVDGVLRAYGDGGTLAYTWHGKKFTAGSHTIKAIAKDRAGNVSDTVLVVNNIR